MANTTVNGYNFTNDNYFRESSNDPNVLRNKTKKDYYIKCFSGKDAEVNIKAEEVKSYYNMNGTPLELSINRAETWDKQLYIYPQIGDKILYFNNSRSDSDENNRIILENYINTPKGKVKYQLGFRNIRFRNIGDESYHYGNQHNFNYLQDGTIKAGLNIDGVTKINDTVRPCLGAISNTNTPVTMTTTLFLDGNVPSANGKTDIDPLLFLGYFRAADYTKALNVASIDEIIKYYFNNIYSIEIEKKKQSRLLKEILIYGADRGKPLSLSELEPVPDINVEELEQEVQEPSINIEPDTLPNIDQLTPIEADEMQPDTLPDPNTESSFILTPVAQEPLIGVNPNSNLLNQDTQPAPEPEIEDYTSNLSSIDTSQIETQLLDLQNSLNNIETQLLKIGNITVCEELRDELNYIKNQINDLTILNHNNHDDLKKHIINHGVIIAEKLEAYYQKLESKLSNIQNFSNENIDYEQEIEKLEDFENSVTSENNQGIANILDYFKITFKGLNMTPLYLLLLLFLMLAGTKLIGGNGKPQKDPVKKFNESYK